MFIFPVQKWDDYKTLPEAQRTQGIEPITQEVVFLVFVSPYFL